MCFFGAFFVVARGQNLSLTSHSIYPTVLSLFELTVAVTKRECAPAPELAAEKAAHCDVHTVN